MFIPIVRLMLVRSDFQQNLLYDYNVTTQMMTSWSLLASGLGAPFALMASFTLIATKWYKTTKSLYNRLKMKVCDKRSRDVAMTTVNGGTHPNDDVDYEAANENNEEKKNFIN